MHIKGESEQDGFDLVSNTVLRQTVATEVYYARSLAYLCDTLYKMNQYSYVSGSWQILPVVMIWYTITVPSQSSVFALSMVLAVICIILLKRF